MRDVIIDGRIGKGGAEVKTTSNSGIKYVKFSLANKRFANGEEETAWFDCISYSPHIIEAADKLTQGIYVVVTCDDFDANPRTDKNGKAWSNITLRVIAVSRINTGGKKSDDEPAAEEHTVSTYTGDTQTKIAQTANAAPAPAPAPAPANVVVDSSDKDDLPF